MLLFQLEESIYVEEEDITVSYTWTNLGLCYRRADNLEEAEKCYQKYERVNIISCAFGAFNAPKAHDIMLFLFMLSIWENIKMCLHFIPLLVYGYGVRYRNTPIDNQVAFHHAYYTRYHGWWWPGDITSQDISNHNFDLAPSKHSGFSTRRAKDKNINKLYWYDVLIYFHHILYARRCFRQRCGLCLVPILKQQTHLCSAYQMWNW